MSAPEDIDRPERLLAEENAAGVLMTRSPRFFRTPKRAGR